MSVDLAEARHQLHELLVALEQALAEEHAALARRDASALEASLSRKEALLEHLQTATLQAQPERAALADLPSAERTDWQAIGERLARCAQANQTNGAAVAMGRQTVDQLLNLMTGRNGTSNVYDARGRLSLADDPQRTREQV